MAAGSVYTPRSTSSRATSAGGTVKRSNAPVTVLVARKPLRRVSWRRTHASKARRNPCAPIGGTSNRTPSHPVGAALPASPVGSGTMSRRSGSTRRAMAWAMWPCWLYDGRRGSASADSARRSVSADATHTVRRPVGSSWSRMSVKRIFEESPSAADQPAAQATMWEGVPSSRRARPRRRPSARVGTRADDCAATVSVHDIGTVPLPATQDALPVINVTEPSKHSVPFPHQIGGQHLN